MKITGYALLFDDVKMSEDPEEFLFTPVEEPNYVRIKDGVIDDFVDAAEEEELVIDSNIIILTLPVKLVKLSRQRLIPLKKKTQTQTTCQWLLTPLFLGLLLSR